MVDAPKPPATKPQSAAHTGRRQNLSKQLFTFNQVDIGKNDNKKVERMLKLERHSNSQVMGRAKPAKYMNRRFQQQLLGSSLKSIDQVPSDDHAMPLLQSTSELK